MSLPLAIETDNGTVQIEVPFDVVDSFSPAEKMVLSAIVATVANSEEDTLGAAGAAAAVYIQRHHDIDAVELARAVADALRAVEVEEE